MPPTLSVKSAAPRTVVAVAARPASLVNSSGALGVHSLAAILSGASCTKRGHDGTRPAAFSSAERRYDAMTSPRFRRRARSRRSSARQQGRVHAGSRPGASSLAACGVAVDPRSTPPVRVLLQTAGSGTTLLPQRGWRSRQIAPPPMVTRQPLGNELSGYRALLLSHPTQLRVQVRQVNRIDELRHRRIGVVVEQGLNH